MAAEGPSSTFLADISTVRRAEEIVARSDGDGSCLPRMPGMTGGGPAKIDQARKAAGHRVPFRRQESAAL
jgi:hypothetical protein